MEYFRVRILLVLRYIVIILEKLFIVFKVYSTSTPRNRELVEAVIVIIINMFSYIRI